MHPRLLLAVLCTLVICSPFSALAADCGKTEEKKLSETLASAGSWANLRNNPGSLRYESQKMLSEAITRVKSLQSPPGLCDDGCTAVPPVVVFDSIPAKFLSDYSDKGKCDALYAKTQASPLRFENRRFPSTEKFNDWYSEFSQGKGTDGGELYAKCDGDCSPRYRTVVRTNDSGLLVNAEVVCGAARDKDDNQYRLAVYARFACAPQKS